MPPPQATARLRISGAGRFARAWLALLAASAPAPAAAQHAPQHAPQHGAHGTGARVAVGAFAAPVYTASDAVPGGDGRGELALVDPLVMAHADALGGRLRVAGMVNLEGLTMPGGVLSTGAWGEGFVDRRHPHTWLHELVASWVQPVASGVSASVSAGKGFAPFGTDDPLVRPALAYPINHHLSQILERLVAAAAVRAGPVAVEAGLFDGDEPTGPGEWPLARRFGDSWSARVTAFPLPGAEIQASTAHVHSPEHRAGAGTDQRKWSVSARYEGRLGPSPVYALAEWARTSEAGGAFVFSSLLAEGAWSPGPHRLLYRFERTDRPEEERELDPFRSVRPHLDNSIVATTRWTVHTLGYGYAAAAGPLRLEPFVELATARVRSATPAAFDPAVFYGRSRLWSLQVGLRLGAGMELHRMGRYGAAEAVPNLIPHQEKNR